MSWGIFSKLFKKRSSSQPVKGSGKGVGGKRGSKKQPPSSKLTTSLPNLPEDQQLDTYPKSFGEFNANTNNRSSITSLDVQNANKSSARPENTQTSLDVLESKKITSGYETSDSEDDERKSRNSLEFLNTLPGSEPKPKARQSRINSVVSVLKDEDLNSITSVSGRISTRQEITLADLIKEAQEKKKQAAVSAAVTEVMHKPVERVNSNRLRRRPSSASDVISVLSSISELDRSTKNQQNSAPNAQELLKENLMLRKNIEILQKQTLERENHEKKENDERIIKLFEILSREAKDEGEKEALTKLLLSKQQEKNEKIINEQGRLIDTLNARCLRLENDILIANTKNESLQIQNKKLKEKSSKEPTPNTLTQHQSLEDISKQMLSQINERDEKFKQLRKRYDDLVGKYRVLEQENSNLMIKIDSMPSDVKIEMAQIRNQAHLVLEENKMLSQQYDLQEKKLVEIQKTHIQEIGRLSKRVIVCEAERVSLLNEIDQLRANNEEMLKKYNEYSIEAQRRIKLEDHLNQVGDLKRKIEEIQVTHRQEIENLTLRLQASENDKRNLIVKCTNLESEVKRLEAENKVIETALNEGIGRKTQKKLQELETQLEIATKNESAAYKSLEKLTKQLSKLKAEKEVFENMAKQNETEIKLKEKQIVEENVKISRLEDQLELYKEKATNKLAKTMEKMKKKDADMMQIQLEKEQKLAQIIKLLNQKQNQIEEMSRVTSSQNDLSKVQSSENKRLKEILTDLKSDNTTNNHFLVTSNKLF